MSDERRETDLTLDRYKERAHTTVTEIVLRTTVAAIPYAGGAILELWNGAAQRRTQERLNAVLDEMRERLESTSEQKVNRAFFDSEEFQTLLYLVIERLHTTHNAEKLKMFGDALANSGSVDFISDDKEVFIRILRDLSGADIHTLDHEYLKNWFPHVHTIDYKPEVLSSLSRLVGQGLVLEKLKPRVSPNQTTGSARLDADQTLKEWLVTPPKSMFVLSPLGTRFLAFVSRETNDNNKVAR
jgi:hypothetical protein